MEGHALTDRQVPHNTTAEQAVLGAMLLSPDARHEATNLLDASDFYTPAHQHVYHAIATMWDAGEPVDPITVAERLRADGLLDLVGGPGLLISLQNECPAITNADRYARLVVDSSVKRRLIAELTAAVDSSYQPGSNADEVMESVTARMAEIRSGIAEEFPSGLWTFDQFLERDDAVRPPWAVPGMLRVGWRALVIASEGLGKALGVTTPIPTPKGWVTMGDVAVGDEVFSDDGTACRVVAATDVMHGRPCYEVVFSDGASIVADANHQWHTLTVKERENGWVGDVRTTEKIAATLRVRAARVANHAVPVAGALQYPRQEQPIDPYLFGYWLGDGSSWHAAITTADPEVVDAFRAGGWVMVEGSGKYEWRINPPERWNRAQSFKSKLRALDVLRAKHVPDVYLAGDVEQRIAIVQGLMDSDGTIGDNGCCEFSVCDRRLAEGFHELITGLGCKATLKEGAATLNGREVGRRWRITFYPEFIPFRLQRKAERWRLAHTRSRLRYIVECRPVPSVPVRCIQVDSQRRMFLAGRECVPTHNSVLFRQVAIAAAAGIHPMLHTPIPKQVSLVVDLENPDEAIIDVCNPIVAEARRTNGEGYEHERAWLWHRPGGINLRARGDRAQLEAVIATVRPSLVCIGPLYKCYQVGGHESDEQAAGEVERVFDDLRTRYQFALMIEHHAPKKTSMSGKRDLNPYGSSLWLRWPELGITLEPIDGDVRNIRLGRFRGDRVVSSWPERLERSKPWPWRGVYPEDDLRSGVHSAGAQDPDVF